MIACYGSSGVEGQPLVIVAARCQPLSKGNFKPSVSTNRSPGQLPPYVFRGRLTSLPSWFEFIFLGLALSKKLRDASLAGLPDRIRAFRSQLNRFVLFVSSH